MYFSIVVEKGYLAENHYMAKSADLDGMGHNPVDVDWYFKIFIRLTNSKKKRKKIKVIISLLNIE